MQWRPIGSSGSEKTAKAADAPANSAHTDEPKSPLSPSGQRSTPDIKLSEIMLFVEWLGAAMQAIEQGAVIPETPPFGSGDVSTWIATIRNLEDRRRENEELLSNLQSEMRDREAYLGRLSQQLQTSIDETKSAQALSQSLRHEVEEYKATLEHLTELMGKVTESEGEIRSVTSDLLTKAIHLDTLTTSFQELSTLLKSASKPPLIE